MAHSPSSLFLFQLCEYAYYLRFVKRLKSPDFDHLLLGVFLHILFQDYIRALIESKKQIDFEAFDRILKAVEGSIPESIDAEFMEIAEVFKNSFILELAANPACDSFVEKGFAFTSKWKRCDWDDPKVWFRGKIDFYQIMNDHAFITDWKSNRVVQSQAKVDSNFQLNCYSLMIYLVYPRVQSFTRTLFFVRYGIPRFNTKMRADVSLLKDDLTRIMEKVEKTEKFKPRIGAHCPDCNYTTVCPEYLKYTSDFKITDLTNKKEAVLLARKLMLANVFVRDAKSKLKTFVDSHGPVKSSGFSADFHVTEKTSFPDVAAIVDFLLKNKVSRDLIWNALKTTNVEIRKITAFKKGLYEKTLKMFGKTEKGSTFELSREDE